MSKTTAIFICILTVCYTHAQSPGPVIELKSGSVRGLSYPIAFGYVINRFVGIPYAAPPVENLRFSAPQPVIPWEGVRDAGMKFAAHCPQNPVHFPWNVTVGDMSEDCLYLNIWRPAGIKSDKPLPVFVWIHGGGYYTQTGNNYDGTALAAIGSGMIVVTINFRLGLLGFLNIPGTELKGNYGMLDQVAALKWIRDNIAAFGGDPNRVTIAGQSSGAASVALHLVSPLSKGLFHQAILQGGGLTSPFSTYTSKDPNYGKPFLKKLNCVSDDVLTCLRSKIAEEFLEATDSFEDANLGKDLPLVTVDGHFLPDEPSQLLEQGRFQKVKAIIGVNKDGGSMTSWKLQYEAAGQKIDHVVFQKVVKESLLVQNGENDMIKRAILYKYTNHADPDSQQQIEENWQQLVGDSWFVAPAIKLAKALAKAGVPPFFYYFTHRAKYSVYPESYGVCHGDELPYVFGGPYVKKMMAAFPLASKYTETERGFDQSIQEAWNNFVTAGDPNIYDKSRVDAADGTIPWPPFTTESEKYLVLDLRMKIEERLLPDRVAFWNDFLPKLSDVDEFVTTTAHTIQKDEL
ncbi:hypothetical protein ACROYT_G019775 [Oculina patagonica]